MCSWRGRWTGASIPIYPKSAAWNWSPMTAPLWFTATCSGSASDVHPALSQRERAEKCRPQGVDGKGLLDIADNVHDDVARRAHVDGHCPARSKKNDKSVRPGIYRWLEVHRGVAWPSRSPWKDGEIPGCAVAGSRKVADQTHGVRGNTVGARDPPCLGAPHRPDPVDPTEAAAGIDDAHRRDRDHCVEAPPVSGGRRALGLRLRDPDHPIAIADLLEVVRYVVRRPGRWVGQQAVWFTGQRQLQDTAVSKGGQIDAAA